MQLLQRFAFTVNFLHPPGGALAQSAKTRQLEYFPSVLQGVWGRNFTLVGIISEFALDAGQGWLALLRGL